MTIDGITLSTLGPVGGALFLFLFPYIQMARGKLVPRSALDDERADTKEARDAWKTEREAHAVTRRQLSTLINGMELTVATVQALPKPGESGGSP